MMMTADARCLPRTMRAMMCYGPGDYRLEEVDVAAPGPEEVLVRVLGVGICASDFKCYSGAPLFWGDENRSGYCQPPVIPGHEFVGEVVALGEGAAAKYGLEIGDHAISEQIVPCWECRFCRQGHYWMCRNGDVYGFRQAAYGAMAEYMRFPCNALNYRVPKALPVQEAVYIEPLACAIHAVQRGEIEFGDTVVIAGCGPLGLGMVAAARLKNPGRLVALDMVDSRLDIAQKAGADVVLNPGKVDAIDEVLRMTDGYGCDVYIEATGNPAAVSQGLHMVRGLGTFVEFSLMRETVTVDWTIIGDQKELTIHGSHLSPYTYPIAIDMLMKGQVPVADIVNEQLPMADFAIGIDMVHGGAEAIKVMLVP